MNKKYYKTTIAFSVLSEEPIPEQMNIDEIYQECIDGDYSGDLGFRSSVEVLNEKEAAQELIKQGSDPSFFGIDESLSD